MKGRRNFGLPSLPSNNFLNLLCLAMATHHLRTFMHMNVAHHAFESQY